MWGWGEGWEGSVCVWGGGVVTASCHRPSTRNTFPLLLGGGMEHNAQTQTRQRFIYNHVNYEYHTITEVGK